MIDNLQICLLVIEQHRHGLLAVIIVQAQIISAYILGCGELICQSSLAHARIAEHCNLVSHILVLILRLLELFDLVHVL